MKKLFVPKGAPGYIAAQKKYTLIRTIIYFALSLAIFVAGYFTTKTRVNLLTVVAILGCLPASKSLVNTIMFFRAQGCSGAVVQQVTKQAGGLPVLFDLFLTSYDKNFQISCLTVKGHNIVALTESAKTDTVRAEEHILECLKTDGHKGYTVKVFDSAEKFMNRIDQMSQTAAEEAGDKDTVFHTLCSVSL